MMRAPVADRVPAVAPEILDEQIETAGEPRPERIVGIDRKPVAVAQNDSRADWIAVTPDGDGKIVGRTHVKSGWGSGISQRPGVIILTSPIPSSRESRNLQP